jgi:hypothetical protein
MLVKSLHHLNFKVAICAPVLRQRLFMLEENDGRFFFGSGLMAKVFRRAIRDLKAYFIKS